MSTEPSTLTKNLGGGPPSPENLFCDLRDQDGVRLHRQRISSAAQRFVETGERDAQLRRSEPERRQIESDFLVSGGHIQKHAKSFVLVAPDRTENGEIV